MSYFACVAQYARLDNFGNPMFTIDESAHLTKILQSYWGLKDNDTELQKVTKMDKVRLPFYGTLFKIIFKKSADEEYFTNGIIDVEKISGRQMYMVLQITSRKMGDKIHVILSHAFLGNNAADQAEFMKLVRR